VHAPLMIDIASTSLSKRDRQRLRHPLVGGLILFTRNWESRAQLTALCKSIKAVRGDVLIAVDHEGGRVQRFKSDGFTHLPPMRSLGEMWMQAPRHAARRASDTRAGPLDACNAATACGYVLGSELRACGVDLSFAPVLDLDHGRSGVIGDRSFNRDPAVVSLLARSLVQGMLQSGVAHCGKHFPGHGYASADSHVAAAVDRRSLTAILADDAAPYRWLSNTLSAVMPAHVVYPTVDARPAGFSPVWLQDILRGRLGFTGAVFSDDLSMAAARRIQGVELSDTAATLAALRAGCDLTLLCNQSLVEEGHAIDRLLEEMTEALLNGEWHASERAEARRTALLPSRAAVDWDALMVQPAYMRALDSLI